MSEYDLETAKAMLKSKRFLYVGFMCHQVIEKILKAFYVAVKEGNPPLDSDIYVAVVLKSIEEDFLTCAAKLFRLRREIDARIEPVLLEESTEKSGFLEEISKTGEIIYSADPSA